MIHRHDLAPADHLLERDRLGAVAARRHHHAEGALVQKVGAGGAEPRRQQPIAGSAVASAVESRFSMQATISGISMNVGSGPPNRRGG